MQKRAAHKRHGAGLWSPTRCTHPRPCEIPAATAMEKHSWLREFLITKAQGERNPFEPMENIQIVITDEAAEET